MTSARTPTILLATTLKWPAAARLAGGFAAASCHVDAHCPRRQPLLESRYLRQWYPSRPFRPQVSLRDAIVASQPDLVIPCDDVALHQLLDVEALARAAGEPEAGIAATIERSLGPLDHYRTLTSRTRAIAVAKELGIRAPETLPIESEADLERALARLGMPAVLKTDGSFGGEGVAFARSEVDARASYRRFARGLSPLRYVLRAARRRDPYCLVLAARPPRPTVCLQAFVGGHPATSAVACWNGRVIAAIHVDVVQARSATGPATVVRPVDDRDMQEAARLIAARFGLSGLHGLDYIRDADGRVHLVETNPRMTPVASLALGAGRDLPFALAAALTGGAPGARPAIGSELIALFPQEWRRDPSSRYLDSAHHDVPWDDPAALSAMLPRAQRKLFRRQHGEAWAASWRNASSAKPAALPH